MSPLFLWKISFFLLWSSHLLLIFKLRVSVRGHPSGKCGLGFVVMFQKRGTPEGLYLVDLARIDPRQLIDSVIGDEYGVKNLSELVEG